MRNIVKISIIIVSVCVLVGCTDKTNNIDNTNMAINTINYHLNITDYFQEKIEFKLSPDAYEIAKESEDYSYTNMEYSLLYEEQEPIFSIHDKKYQKEIKDSGEGVEVILSYNYKENEFINSNYIINCFENYKIYSKDDYLEINLSGEFYCLENKNLNIFIRSNHEVVETNGNLNDGEYQWIIDESNYQNVNIKYKINRSYSDMAQVVYDDSSSPKAGGIIKDIIIIIFLLIGVFALSKLSKKFR